MKKVMLYIEDGHIQDSLDLIEVARLLYKDEKVQTYALVIHGGLPSVQGFCDVIMHLVDDRLQSFDQRGIGDVVTAVHTRYSFDAILFLATPMGRLLAPRVAMQLRTGLVADVTGIASDDEGLVVTRPAYGGKIMAGIRFTGDGPVMMSVRPAVFTHTQGQKVDSRLVLLEGLSYRYGSMRKTKTEEKKIAYDIRDSTVLISAGGGMSDMHLLGKLAALLGGEVSASRAVVDKGVLPRAMQVGQSGKTVSPKLYMALGIHGSIQHVEGLKDVQHIISVNTNRNAPMCSISDIVVEGEALPFIQRLVQRIEKGKQLCM
ncbi:MAG: electron transfer flavoprotein subunit alpha/FixB family protein [Sphaerochaeta sp.]|nr:electron transfer flavoprotein subunit alpha/FixB family protein [Sphaerochaeta sp.]